MTDRTNVDILGTLLFKKKSNLYTEINFLELVLYK